MKTITIDGVEYNLLPKVKFKAGDWVVIDNCHNSIYQVDSVREYDYMLRHTHGGLMPFPFSSAERLRLWTIQDAKDGDVLVDTLSGTRALTILFISINEDDSISSYCGWNGYTFRVPIDGLGYGTLSSTRYVPATKEQRGLFFTKMREAGYQWDSEKKELRKIKPHYDISNFKPYQKVLIRFGNNDTWRADFFSHIKEDRGRYFVGIGYANKQCIPFEGNEHLLGTTDMCDEQFINW